MQAQDSSARPVNVAKPIGWAASQHDWQAAAPPSIVAEQVAALEVVLVLPEVVEEPVVPPVPPVLVPVVVPLPPPPDELHAKMPAGAAQATMRRAVRRERAMGVESFRHAEE